MSVFHNLYTEKYEKYEQRQKFTDFVSHFNYFDNYMTSLLSSFTWKNLPDERLPSFMIEEMFQYGGCVAGILDDGAPRIYSAFLNGNLLPNGLMTKCTIIRPDATEKTFPIDDVVVGFNNCFRMPYIFKVNQYAEQTNYIFLAILSAIKKAIMPAIINTSDESLMKELLDIKTSDMRNLETFLVSLKSRFDTKDMDIQQIYDNTKIDVLALWDVFTRSKNNFYTTFGINNVEIQKRERLTEAEGSGNDEITRYTLFNDMYMRRVEFKDAFNKKFGTDIYFEVNRDISTVYQLQLSNDEKVEIGNISESRGATIVNDRSPDKEIEEDDKIED